MRCQVLKFMWSVSPGDGEIEGVEICGIESPIEVAMNRLARRIDVVRVKAYLLFIVYHSPKSFCVFVDLFIQFFQRLYGVT